MTVVLSVYWFVSIFSILLAYRMELYHLRKNSDKSFGILLVFVLGLSFGLSMIVSGLTGMIVGWPDIFYVLGVSFAYHMVISIGVLLHLIHEAKRLSYLVFQ